MQIVSISNRGEMQDWQGFFASTFWYDAKFNSGLGAPTKGRLLPNSLRDTQGRKCYPAFAAARPDEPFGRAMWRQFFDEANFWYSEDFSISLSRWLSGPLHCEMTALDYLVQVSLVSCIRC